MIGKQMTNAKMLTKLNNAHKKIKMAMKSIESLEPIIDTIDLKNGESRATKRSAGQSYDDCKSTILHVETLIIDEINKMKNV